MQPGDHATWIGVVAAFIVGAGGVAVGIVGLLIARGARVEAKKVNEVAAEANEVSKKANDLAAAALQSCDLRWELQWVPLDTGKAGLPLTSAPTSSQFALTAPSRSAPTSCTAVTRLPQDSTQFAAGSFLTLPSPEPTAC